ncbi:hypothetical protein MTR67_018022, partial [Solanum verrucosum]
TDGQAERTTLTLEDMLRACVIDFKGNWDDQLPVIEFAFNNSYYSSIQMAPYEDLYKRRCRSSIGWFDVGEAGLIGPYLVHQTMDEAKIIQERISKWIDNVAYELELPPELATVHHIFHISMLNKCISDPSFIIPTENIGIKDNISYEEILVEILDRQVRKLRTKEVVSVKVLWRSHFTEEVTWEDEEDMKKRCPHLFSSREIPDQDNDFL